MLVIELQWFFPIKDTVEDNVLLVTNYFLLQLEVKSVYSWIYTLPCVVHSVSHLY